MLLNCGVGEDSWQSLGLQGDPTSPLRNQSWIFIGRTVAEAETPILWPPDANSWLIWKYPDAGKYWSWRRRGRQRMRWLDGHHRCGGDERSRQRKKMNSFSISPSSEYSGGWSGWISLQSKGLSRIFSNTTVQKHHSFGAQLSLCSNSHNHTRLLENHSFD